MEASRAGSSEPIWARDPAGAGHVVPAAVTTRTNGTQEGVETPGHRAGTPARTRVRPLGQAQRRRISRPPATS